MLCFLAKERAYRFLYWTQTYSPAANSAEVLGFLLPPQPVRNLVVTVLANVTFEGTPVLPDVISSLLCPPGTQRVNNADLSYTCSACAIGFFNLVANGSCTPCPSGALCPGGTAIYADQYYWRTPPQDASDASDPFLLDPPFTYCGINSACCTEGNFTSLIGCAIEDGCGPNYNSSSKLCSECNAGFYSWGGECLECDQSYYSVIIAGTYVASIAFIVFLLVIPKWRSNFLTDMIFFFQIANMLVGPAISQAFMGIINLNIDSLVNGSSHCLAPLSPVKSSSSSTSTRASSSATSSSSLSSATGGTVYASHTRTSTPSTTFSRAGSRIAPCARSWRLALSRYLTINKEKKISI